MNSVNFDFPMTVFTDDEVCVVEDEALFQRRLGQYRLICAGGGVVIKGNEVLMIHRLGKWDFPKGKQEIGEDIVETACREVMEETGLARVEVLKPLPDTWHTYSLHDESILKRSCWFLMRTDAEYTLKPQWEEDISQAVWVPIPEVERKLENSYASLKQFWHQVVNLL